MKRKLRAVFNALKTNSVPFKRYDLKKLKGGGSFFRIRIGRIRIVYEVRYSEQKILIHYTGYREGAYKQAENA